LTDRFRRVDAIFDAAVDLSGDEQAECLDRACAGDEEMRAEVLELLREYHRSDSFLDSPAAQIAAPLLDAAAALAGPVPDRVGPFRVVREIGRGGMGRVFLAERVDGQFDQRVALKVIQTGAPGVVKRFMEERRILALLAHPGIARLLDGGITNGGLPYFAMELVDGEPIDRYCDSHELSLDERLDLFVRVCDAVSYAHQHLVIHRDLKPSNILVTGDGQVKLLDFGIAKVLGPRSAGDLTQTEHSVMTPEFAAPEQVRGTSISTATDVYSLGVLLYMLLTGERPYDVRGKSPAEVERIVCTEVPPKPSTQVTPAMRRRVRGDLDLIVMTALQKEEARRYQSPAALADDLRRFRDGHAILARRDSTVYRLRKFVGRHRIGVAAGTLGVLGLIGAASRERVLRNDAELAARKSSEVEAFLVSVFDVADPMGRRATEGGSVTARELLDRGASRIDSTLVAQPEVQAQLRSVLGRVYSNLGLYDKATPLLQRALAQRATVSGAADSTVATTMDLLGMSLLRQDKYADAEPLLRAALDHRRRIFGNAHASTAESVTHLATLFEERNDYNAAEPLYREALTILETAFGDSAVEVGDVMNDLGLLLLRNSKHDEGERMLRRSLEIKVRHLGENHPHTAATMQNLAQLFQTRGRYPEAEAFHRRSLAAKRRALGDVHPSVTIGLNNLANLLTRQMGKLEEGEALAREALALDRQIFGENHSYVAASLANVGVIARMQGRFDEADSLLRQALAVNRKVFTEPHERTAGNLSAIAQIRYAIGDGRGAISHMRQAHAQYRKLLGETHLNTIITTGSLGFILAEHGDPVEGESLLRASLARLDPGNGAHHAQVISNEIGLGKALLAQGRADEALPVLERAVGMGKKQFGEGNYRTGEALLLYGKALAAKRRYAEGESMLREAVAALEKNRRGQPRLYARALAAVNSPR
jgi:serine/threonine-protein kinase